MNTNLKSKDAFDLLQLANKIEHSITPDNVSLDQKWYSYKYMAVYMLVLNFYDPANYT